MRFRLQADVPVGYYLSGGLDSSLVTSMGFAAAPETHRATLSIRFEDQEICESRFQQLMVDRLGSDHHEIVFGWERISESLARMVAHSECPVKETYNTCAMALSRMARDQGLRVILAGQGADELFAGYMGYRFDTVRRHEPDPFDLDEMMEGELRRQLWGDEHLFYEINQHALRETKAAFYSGAVMARYADFDCLERPVVNKARLRGRHPLHQRSYLDLKLRLGDHLLGDHGDRMMLMNSVEGRYPFLDQDVVEFVRTLPPEFKLRGGIEKYAVKRVAEPFVPKAIIDREKFGFRAPASPYLICQNIKWLRTCFLERVKAQGYFNPAVIEDLKRRYRHDASLNPHLERPAHDRSPSECFWTRSSVASLTQPGRMRHAFRPLNLACHQLSVTPSWWPAIGWPSRRQRPGARAGLRARWEPVACKHQPGSKTCTATDSARRENPSGPRVKVTAPDHAGSEWIDDQLSDVLTGGPGASTGSGLAVRGSDAAVGIYQQIWRRTSSSSTSAAQAISGALCDAG